MKIILKYRLNLIMPKIGFEPLSPTIRKKRPSLFSQANTIKQLMDDNNWNQSQVAEYLGISRVRISQVLKVLKLNQEQLENVKQDGRIVSNKVKNLKV